MLLFRFASAILAVFAISLRALMFGKLSVRTVMAVDGSFRLGSVMMGMAKRSARAMSCVTVLSPVVIGIAGGGMTIVPFGRSLSHFGAETGPTDR
jgi:hypothetical protein